MDEYNCLDEKDYLASIAGYLETISDTLCDLLDEVRKVRK